MLVLIFMSELAVQVLAGPAALKGPAVIPAPVVTRQFNAPGVGYMNTVIGSRQSLMPGSAEVDQ